MAEVAPRRRRHSSVGLHSGDSGHTLTGARALDLSGGRLSSSLNMGEGFKSRVTGSRGRGLMEPGVRSGDRGATAARFRSGADGRVRSGVDTKVMVLGMAGVGKSALVVRFLTNRFIWEYDPTLESTHRHVAHIDEEQVVMEILDTAGQEEVWRRESSVLWADGFVLVYAINDRASYDTARAVKARLDHLKRTNVHCVLVANKADLLHERRVSYSEGESLAQDMACAFYETSASEGGSDITDLFHDLHREIKRHKMADTKCRRRSSAHHVLNVFNRVLNKIGNT